MDLLNTFASLFSNFGNLTWQMVVMWGIGALLIYLAIAKKMEPSLLLPMGFGAILVNLPLSGAITQGDTVGPISALFEAGMSNELFPLLLFIGIGAMIDFGPLLEKPWLMLFGAAAQFGIFFTLFLAGFFFDLKDAASIAVIGAADGPTAIFVANTLNSQYLGAIMVAAYSYMALVPIVQPPVIRLLTTQKERCIRMSYEKGSVSQLTKILFPIVVTIIAGMVAPASVALVGFLMFGNLLLLILVDNIDGRIIIRYFYLLNLSGILRYLDTGEEFLDLSFDMIYIYITHDDNSLIVWAIPFAIVSTESFWLTTIDNAHQTDRETVAILFALIELRK